MTHENDIQNGSLSTNETLEQKHDSHTKIEQEYLNLSSAINKQADHLCQETQARILNNTQNVVQDIMRIESARNAASIDRGKVYFSNWLTKSCASLGMHPFSLLKLGFSAGTIASVFMLSILLIPKFTTTQDTDTQALPFFSSVVLLDVAIEHSEEDLQLIQDLELYETLLIEPL